MDVEEIGGNQLKKLYPFVDQSKTPLPSCWNRNDKFPSLSLTQANARVRVRGRGAQMTAAIRSDHPIPPVCGLYYFEVHVKDKGRQGCICIGLSQEGAPLDRMPGWCELSFGYYGENGKIFAGSDSGIPYGPTFSSGDVIGCGLNFAEKSCFYTKNGQNIGTAFRNLEGTFYASVGLVTAGETVDVNFGKMPFVYNILEDMKEVQAHVQGSIRCHALPPASSEWLQRLVSDYLVHHGFTASAQSFDKNNSRLFLKEAKNRQDVMNLVKCSRFDDAIQRVQEFYPRLFEQKPELLLWLKCQEFLEALINFYDEQRSHHSTNGTPKSTAPSEKLSNRSRISTSPKNRRAIAQPISSSLRSSPIRLKSPRPFRRSASPVATELVLNGCEKFRSSSPEYFDPSTSLENGTKNVVCDGISSNDHAENGTHKATSCEKPIQGDECAPSSTIFYDASPYLHNGIDGPAYDTDGDCSMMDLTCVVDADNGCSRIEQYVAHGRELFEMHTQLKDGCGGNSSMLAKCYQILREAFDVIAFTEPGLDCGHHQIEPQRLECFLLALNSAMLEMQDCTSKSALEVIYGHSQRLRQEMVKNGLGAAAFVDVDHFIKG